MVFGFSHEKIQGLHVNMDLTLPVLMKIAMPIVNNIPVPVLTGSKFFFFDTRRSAPPHFTFLLDRSFAVSLV